VTVCVCAAAAAANTVNIAASANPFFLVMI
jgi:hypothetical protein